MVFCRYKECLPPVPHQYLEDFNQRKRAIFCKIFIFADGRCMFPLAGTENFAKVVWSWVIWSGRKFCEITDFMFVQFHRFLVLCMVLTIQLYIHMALYKDLFFFFYKNASFMCNLRHFISFELLIPKTIYKLELSRPKRSRMGRAAPMLICMSKCFDLCNKYVCLLLLTDFGKIITEMICLNKSLCFMKIVLVAREGCDNCWLTLHLILT